MKLVLEQPSDAPEVDFQVTSALYSPYLSDLSKDRDDYSDWETFK